jgi:hypothetical protein
MVRNIRRAASPWNTRKGNVEFWEIECYGQVEAYSHPEYRQELLYFLDGTVVEEGV